MLAGKRVLLLGKLGGLSKRESQEVLRRSGAKIQESASSQVQLIVIGHEHSGLDELLDQHQGLREGLASGAIEVVDESQLWERQLYTPAMLAELLAVPVRTVRRWYRAGLIQPVKEVLHLPLFDFAELTTARQLAKWCQEGASVQSIQRQLSALSELSQSGDRPLQQLAITSEGKQLLLRRGQSLLESTGQFRFSFDAEGTDDEVVQTISISKLTRSEGAADGGVPTTLEQMVEQALLAEDEEQLDLAIDWYRSALAAFGPNADINFQLAELLYRQGDSSAARERYYMALELNDGLVEARANLGCVLAESGQLELAIAAFEGTLKQLEDYADVHFHLARALDDVGQANRALKHWQRFVELAPASPWVEEAQQRLQQVQPALEF